MFEHPNEVGFDQFIGPKSNDQVDPAVSQRDLSIISSMVLYGADPPFH